MLRLTTDRHVSRIISATADFLAHLNWHSNGPLYSNAVIGTLAVDGWPFTFGRLQRGGAWAGCGPIQAPHRCTKCSSSPINGQCTNFILFDVEPKLPLHSKGLNVNN